MRFGGDVAAYAHFDIFAGDLVGDGVEDLAEGLARPWMLVVVAPVALGVVCGVEHVFAVFVEVLECLEARLTELADVCVIVEDRVAEDDGGADHLDRLEPERLHEVIDGVRGEMGVAVELGDPCLVEDWQALELPGDDLAANPVAGFKQRRLEHARAPVFQLIRGQQSSGPAAYDRNTHHRRRSPDPRYPARDLGKRREAVLSQATSVTPKSVRKLQDLP